MKTPGKPGVFCFLRPFVVHSWCIFRRIATTTRCFHTRHGGGPMFRGAASCVSTRVTEAFSGPVALRPRASAGRVPHPGRPSTARPEYYVAHGEPILSEPPDPSGALHPAFSRYRMGTAGSGRSLCQSHPRFRRPSSPGLVQRDPELGRPDSPPYTQNGFFPRRSGFPIRSRHWIAPLSPLHSSSPRRP